jgi:hypothetical protein
MGWIGGPLRVTATAVWYGHGKSCSVVFPRNRNGEVDRSGNCDTDASCLCYVVSNFSSYAAESEATPYLTQLPSFLHGESAGTLFTSARRSLARLEMDKEIDK